MAAQQSPVGCCVAQWVRAAALIRVSLVRFQPQQQILGNKKGRESDGL